MEKYSTKELVNELTQREGVREILAEPYEEYMIQVDNNKYYSNGPARILEIRD